MCSALPPIGGENTVKGFVASVEDLFVRFPKCCFVFIEGHIQLRNFFPVTHFLYIVEARTDLGKQFKQPVQPSHHSGKVIGARATAESAELSRDPKVGYRKVRCIPYLVKTTVLWAPVRFNAAVAAIILSNGLTSCKILRYNKYNKTGHIHTTKSVHFSKLLINSAGRLL